MVDLLKGKGKGMIATEKALRVKWNVVVLTLEV